MIILPFYNNVAFIMFISLLLLCIKYKSPDAYSFFDFFSIQDALFDTARLLKFQIFVRPGCLICTAYLFFHRILATPH